MVFYHTINPVLLQLDPIQIRYYGLVYVVGFLVAYYLLRRFSQEGIVNIDKQSLQDLVFYGAIGIVVCARLFYCIVYNFSYYVTKPWEILAIWQGGMSFHGGLIGAIIVIWWFTKKHKLDLMTFFGLFTIPAAFAVFIGRIANFINGELYGIETDAWYCIDYTKNVFINGPQGCRFPSQLFEAAKNLLIFIVLYSLRKVKNKAILFWLFVSMYGFLRFFIGFIRAPDPQIGYLWLGLTMGQYLNILMVVVGLPFLILAVRKNKKLKE